MNKNTLPSTKSNLIDEFEKQLKNKRKEITLKMTNDMNEITGIINNCDVEEKKKKILLKNFQKTFICKQKLRNSIVTMDSEFKKSKLTIQNFLKNQNLCLIKLKNL